MGEGEERRGTRGKKIFHLFWNTRVAPLHKTSLGLLITRHAARHTHHSSTGHYDVREPLTSPKHIRVLYVPPSDISRPLDALARLGAGTTRWALSLSCPASRVPPFPPSPPATPSTWLLFSASFYYHFYLSTPLSLPLFMRYVRPHASSLIPTSYLPYTTYVHSSTASSRTLSSLHHALCLTPHPLSSPYTCHTPLHSSTTS